MSKLNQNIIICTNFKKYLTFLPNPRSQGSAFSQFLISCCSSPLSHLLDMQHNHFLLLTPPQGSMVCKRQNNSLHGLLCFIPLNVICNMTTFRKDKNDPTAGVQGVCKGKSFTSILLYTSFPLMFGICPKSK